jgi:hypothetical protein
MSAVDHAESAVVGGVNHSSVKPKPRPMKASPRSNTCGGLTEIVDVPCSTRAIEREIPEVRFLKSLDFPDRINRSSVSRYPWKASAGLCT